MEQFLERRRLMTAAAWDLDGGVVLVAAGDEIPVPGRGDPTYPFRAHSEYLCLTDRERPGGVLAFDPGEGWVEFVAPVTAEELLWTGLDGNREGVPEGTRPLEGFVHGRTLRRLGVTPDADAELRDALIRVRRPKDDVEVERMRVAAEATRAGFAELVPLIEAGRSERELQVALEAAFLRNGGDFLAFDTIVAAGERTAVLHSAPMARATRDGELLLVDAGAEFRGYASDVTRMYAVVARSGASRRSSMRRCVRLAGPPSPHAGRASNGGRSTGRQRSSSRTDSSSLACCVVVVSRLSRAAPPRSSFLTASATWSGSASETQARVRRGAGARARAAAVAH